MIAKGINAEQDAYRIFNPDERGTTYKGDRHRSRLDGIIIASSLIRGPERVAHTERIPPEK